ncbi:LPXTG cell wall anchor domain-containing protein, partial [Hymenobacter segetis]
VVVNLPAVPEATSALFESRLWEGVGAVLFVFTAGYRAFTDGYNMLLWLGVCGLVGAVGLLVVWRRHRKTALAAA